MKRQPWKDYVLITVFALIFTVSAVYLYREYRACQAKGGQLVRGLFRPVCITPR